MKKTRKDKYLARKNQPLATHLENVARLARKFGAIFGAENIAYFIGLVHDLGKYTKAFQAYIIESIKDGDVRRGDIIHAFQGSRFILEKIQEPLIAEIIANIVAAHHGGLYDGVSNGKKPIYEKIEKYDSKLYYVEAKKAFENEILMRQDFAKLCVDEISKALNICKEKKLNGLFTLHLFTKALFSCLVDADRCDAARWNIENEIEQSSPNWTKRIEELENHLNCVKSEANINISRIRKMISDQCGEAGKRERGIYTLCVPTGGGKTLSSLRFALKHAQERGLDRIIYVIPYLSILDQTAKTIREALNCSKDDNFVLEHHSNIDIPENEEDENEYKLLTSRWDSPIILTTMVQFLETIYSNKASKLRKFHNMANSVVIFDEVQALPIKCVHLFNDAINFLHIFGKTTVLLCTATQPSLDKVCRPILLSKNSSLTSICAKDLKCFNRAIIIDKTKPEGWTIEELAQFTQSQLDFGKNTLVILNTKYEVKSLYNMCKCFKYEKAFLTTDLCPEHRSKTLDQTRENLNKERPVLCISTQLIEAGVDISFDCVIRAGAGLDSIVQAAGRCNRNGESATLQEVYVVNIKDERLSLLPEIEDGKRATKIVFCEKRSKNLLSDDALDLFYKYYFHRQKDKMDYNVAKSTKVYDLLNHNTLEVTAYEEQNQRKYQGLPCAFKSAADKFSVIDRGQTGIVVPYGGAMKLVERLKAEYNLKDKMNTLKKLQKYTISVYSYVLNKLEKAGAITMIDDTFYLLSSEYYDDKAGLLLEDKFSFMYVGD
ncbi:MAG: CRISPR-associated helicase Cas3' [Helicobacteraceae bacterium]|nr:CRISPR-associated helicase Cas3' [Helicobacteraceae bacterium]